MSRISMSCKVVSGTPATFQKWVSGTMPSPVQTMNPESKVSTIRKTHVGRITSWMASRFILNSVNTKNWNGRMVKTTNNGWKRSKYAEYSCKWPWGNKITIAPNKNNRMEMERRSDQFLEIKFLSLSGILPFIYIYRARRRHANAHMIVNNTMLNLAIE